MESVDICNMTLARLIDEPADKDITPNDLRQFIVAPPNSSSSVEFRKRFLGRYFVEQAIQDK